MTLFSNTGKDFTRTINKFKEVFMSGKTSKLGNMLKRDVEGAMTGVVLGAVLPPPGPIIDGPTIPPKLNIPRMITLGIIYGGIGTIGGLLER